MNVLSLFDGISCGRVALERVGIQVKHYYASEIDKYATQVSQNNYPDIIRLGDINNWESWNIDWTSIDLILAGSPCQGFSFAGKQLAFDDKRSALFFRFAEILSHVQSINPNVKFLLENVRMKKDYEHIITKLLDTEPVLINSALVSAQNRKRLYWANWHFEQPEDKGILLKDIIHKNTITDKRYICSQKYVDYIHRRQRSRKSMCGVLNINDAKSVALTARMYSSWNGNFVRMCYFDEYFNVENLRQLTPIECERLQTLPDNYTQGISNNQRYKCLGNGWTVDVVTHILTGLN